MWIEISFPAKYSKKMEPCEPLKPATVLRTVRFDYGSSGFMYFSHRAVFKGKRTAKNERFEVFHQTVRSGPDFKTLLISVMSYNLQELPTA